MVISEETANSYEGKTGCIPTELVTENGYSIVRSCEMDGAGKYKFVVSNSDEQTCEVIVEFDRAAIMLVQSCRRRPLASKSAFWINCAERSLATYLWEKNECPPNGRLTLKDVCLDDLDAARRWG
ncbi:MAG: hypothetical protein WBP93_11665 [Pyrinomonadaceae bacterium]